MLRLTFYLMTLHPLATDGARCLCLSQQHIMNSIDLCAIVPYFITLATVLTEDKSRDDGRLSRGGAGQEKGASLGE